MRVDDGLIEELQHLSDVEFEVTVPREIEFMAGLSNFSLDISICFILFNSVVSVSCTEVKVFEAVLVLLVETLYATSGVVLNGKLKARTH